MSHQPVKSLSVAAVLTSFALLMSIGASEAAQRQPEVPKGKISSLFDGDVPPEIPNECLMARSNYDEVPTLRVQLGLDSGVRPSKPDATGQSELGIDVSTDEYRLVKENFRRRSSVDIDQLREELGKAFPDSLVGVTWDIDTVVVHHLEADTRTAVLIEQASLPMTGDAELSVRSIKRGVPWVRAVQNMRTLEDERAPKLWYDNETGIAAASLDETCGMAIFYAHHKADLPKLNESIASRFKRSDDFVLLPLPNDYRGQMADRTDHHLPHSGGNAIFIDNNESNCTSNIPWIKQNLEVWAVTAGHCVNNNAPGAAPWFTVAEETFSGGDGGTRIDTGGSNPVVYVDYRGNIEAAVTLINVAGEKRTNIGTDPTTTWRTMNWWQWDPIGGSSPGIGWDAVGDVVCQGGVGSGRLRCGVITQRFHFQNSGFEDVFGFNTWFTNQRQATTDACGGDSGGTVYRVSDVTLTGMVSARIGASAGGNCNQMVQYGHISRLVTDIGLYAPVNTDTP